MISLFRPGIPGCPFLDDVSLWISHPDPNEAIRMLNADLASIYDWSVFNLVCFDCFDASKFHLFDLGKLDFSQELLDSVMFGDVPCMD